MVCLLTLARARKSDGDGEVVIGYNLCERAVLPLFGRHHSIEVAAVRDVAGDQQSSPRGLRDRDGVVRTLDALDATNDEFLSLTA